MIDNELFLFMIANSINLVVLVFIFTFSLFLLNLQNNRFVFKDTSFSYSSDVDAIINKEVSPANKTILCFFRRLYYS